jgi:hypothetical protein
MESYIGISNPSEILHIIYTRTTGAIVMNSNQTHYYNSNMVVIMKLVLHK